MKSLDFLNEGIAEDAHEMHLDHEVQMARQELYHAAEDAIALHKLLRHVSEQQGLEGWVSSKVTLAADYLKTVREHLEYQLMSGGPAENVVAVVGDSMPVAEGEVTKTPTGLKHKATDKYGNGEEDSNHHPGGNRSGFPNPGKYARDLDHVNKDLVKKLDASMGINWKKQGPKGMKVDEMSAGSVATVVNPTPKNKAKVGSLFGGTYKQPKKAK